MSNVLVYDYIKCLSTCLVASTSSQYIDYIINMIKYSKLSSALSLYMIKYSKLCGDSLQGDTTQLLAS